MNQGNTPNIEPIKVIENQSLNNEQEKITDEKDTKDNKCLAIVAMNIA